MGGKEGKCRSFRKNNFLYFHTAPYAVNINSFQCSFAMILGGLSADGGCKRHTQIQQNMELH